MYRWRKWIWPGLITVVLLTFLAVIQNRDRIESDLASRTTSNLQAEHAWAGVKLEGRDLTLTGTAPDEEARGLAARIAENTYDVRVVNNQASVLPIQSPFTFSGERSGNVVKLDGFVPNAATGAELLDAVKVALPDADISSSFTIARGAPTGFVDLGKFAIGQMTRLDDSRFSLNDAQYSLSGTAASIEGYKALSAETKATLPGGGKAGEITITPPTLKPYLFTAEKSDNSLTLGGYVSSAEQKAQLIDFAKETGNSDQVIDRTELVLGQPDGTMDTAQFAIAQLGNLKTGKVSISDKAYTIEAVAGSIAGHKAALAAHGSALPGGATVEQVKITPPTLSPYLFSAQKSGNSISLSGYIPTRNDRENMIQAARKAAGGEAGQDNLDLVLGAPDGFSSLASFGFSQLAELSSGEFKISDNRYSIQGVADSVVAFDRVTQGARGTLPGNGILAEIDITGPTTSPYTFHAEKSETGYTLSGFAPSQDIRDRLNKLLADGTNGLKIIDNLELAFGSQPGFEALAAFGLAQLQQLQSGRVSLSDSNYSIEGTAGSAAIHDALTNQLQAQLPGEGVVQSQNIVRPDITPYLAKFVKSDNTIELNGYVPSAAVMSALMKKTSDNNTGAKIISHLVVGSGAPDGFAALAGYGAQQLGHLSSGEVVMSDLDFSISGTASDPDNYARISENLARPLPGKGRLVSADIKAPKLTNYQWSVDYTGDQAVISGFVPDEPTRGDIMERAKEALPQVNIEDTMQIADGAPANFADTARFALGLLQNFKSGKVSLTNSRFDVGGEAVSPEALERTTAALSGLPEGVELGEENVQPPTVSPYTWRALYDGGSLKLTGYVSDDAMRQTITTAAKSSFPNASIVDDMVTAAGATDTFGSASNFALSALSSLSEGEADIADDYLSISGQARTFETFERVTTDLRRNVPAGVVTRDVDIKPPNASPYQLLVSKQADEIEIAGHMPNSFARIQVLNSVKQSNPGANVSNQTKIATGVPEGLDWIKAAEFVGSLTVGLSSAEASLEDKSLSITGIAKSNSSYDEVNSKLDGLANVGLELANAVIKQPVIDPYEWQLVKTPGGVTLSGYAESDERAAANLEKIKSGLSVKQISGNQQIGPGTPENFDTAIDLGISMLSRLESGTLKLSNTKFSITGEALTGVAANSVRIRVKESLPEGYSGSHDISVREIKQSDFVKPDKCQKLMSEILEGNQILFEINKSVIKQESYGLLDRLVYVTQQCPKAKVEIGGHTDSDGTDVYNQRLSESRANSVLKYLSKSGVLPSRLKAIGYGETQPIAENETDEGKQKNRRIEFKVIEKEG